MMFIKSYHYGIKYVSDLLQLEPSNVKFHIISDILGHWYTLVNAISFSDANENDLCIDVFHGNHYEIKYLSILLQLKQCNVMLELISGIIALWYDM